MKKSKREQQAPVPATAVTKPTVWWPWAAGLGALLAALTVYGPALRGPFVLDDLYLIFANPAASTAPLRYWIGNNRPLLMASYYLNYQWGGADPFSYHLGNVLLHLLTAAVIAWILWRLLELAGVTGGQAVLSIFGGGLFLLHPLQTESVAYVASRSETLSVLLYMLAFALFLHRRTESMTILRALSIIALFAAAVSTKEHTLTLPALLILADLFWGLGGVRKNAVLYGLLAAASAGGAWFVWRLVSVADTAGFRIRDLSPATYFFTQCRVLWTYIRLFFLPFGQNSDPDIPLSNGLLDHGTIFGLAALVALLAAAWIYRQRYPLASFGIFVFLLLISPTSSIVPIRDVLAERRMYLPFLGLALVPIEFLRRLKESQAIGIAAVALAICAFLTYQRSAVWSDPLLLWQDTVAKSPNKWRPRFQLAHAHYLAGECPQAVEHFQAATKLGPSDVPLLVDYGLALDCVGRSNEAVEKLRQAAGMEPSAHVLSQIGMVFAKQKKFPEALAALAEAEKANPQFEMTYIYKGGVYELSGDRAAAAREYQRALGINSSNQLARQGMARLSR